MKGKLLFFSILFLSIASTILVSRSFRVTQIPNGNQAQCLNCHNSEFGGSRNVFGQAIQSGFLSTPGPSGNVQWGPELAALDSDNDGFTNGEELGDPDGTWSQGQPAPGDPNNISNPGDPNSTPPVVSITELDGIPTTYELSQNYPNPFNPTTTINFSTTQAGNVSLTIYNSLGEEIETLVNEFLPSGNYAFDWDARNLTSGVYFYRLTANNFVETKKMMLVK